MAVEALWSVRFGHAGGGEFVGVNGGIVVLETGRVLGGDSFFSYVGSYDVQGSQISGSIRIARHNDDPGSIDAWNTGDNEFDVNFALALDENMRLAEGGMVRAGFPTIGLRLKRIAELPGG